MAEIRVPKYRTITDDFRVIECPGFTLKLENSLASISKWESKFKKPFLEASEFTTEEFIYYVECMILNPTEIPKDATSYLTMDNVSEIQNFIVDYPSATVIKHNGEGKKKKGPKRFITSELIYAYMAQARIPYEAQFWNIRRLLNTIEIVAIENNPKKEKVPKSQTMSKYRAANKARRPRRN